MKEKILFLPVGFFEYDQAIEQEMKNIGYEVTTFSPMTSYGKIYQKIYNVLTRGKYIKKRTEKLQKKFFENCEEQYDYVFAIVGRHINPKLFNEFQKKQKKAKYILYLWDDVKDSRNFENIKGLFDIIVTFSKEDAEQYNYKFLPLFYVKDYLYKKDKDAKKYQLCMIGTIHSGRLDVWNKIVENYKLQNVQKYLYLLAGTVSSLLIGKKTLHDHNIDSSNVHIYGLPLQEVASKMRISKIAVDVQFGTQTGLTMRTIESLASQTKLITTNTQVKNYDFYNSQNICVIEKENPIISKEFFETEYVSLSDELLYKYSLNHWIKEIFEVTS